jgi:aryl-alcohol dehydrogenase-like predicted oxidoreductase
VLGEPAVDAVILGPRRPEHLAPALAALDLDLDDAERAALGGKPRNDPSGQ